MDDVPIPLRPAFDSPLPTDEAILRSIERRVRRAEGSRDLKRESPENRSLTNMIQSHDPRRWQEARWLGSR